jgi:hypothetical protein
MGTKPATVCFLSKAYIRSRSLQNKSDKTVQNKVAAHLNGGLLVEEFMHPEGPATRKLQQAFPRVSSNRRKSPVITTIALRFEVLTAVSTKMAVCWAVAPCRLV